MNNYYVYRHIRLDSGLPFYIGKGTKNRAYKKGKRNPYWHSVVKKCNYRVEIMLKNLTEQQALDKEVEFIKLYKSIGCCKANFTNGGEGISGYKWTEDQKKEHSFKTNISNKCHIGNSHAKNYKHTKSAKIKISNASKGKIYSQETKNKLSKAHTGKKLTEEHKKKLSNSHKGKSKNGKKVFCITNNTIYNSTAEVAKLLNLNQSNISAVCRGSRKHVNNMLFKYLGDL